MSRGRRHDLRRRILWAFAGFALAVAAVFGASAAAVLYSVEDTFFNRLLAEEATHLEQQRSNGAQWGVPRQSWMTVHESPDGDSIGAALAVYGVVLTQSFRVRSSGAPYLATAWAGFTAKSSTLGART